MTQADVTIVILAAGKGTRMKSDRPKVLHEIAGLSLIGHVLKTAALQGSKRRIVVIAPDMDDVANAIVTQDNGATIAVQKTQAGTGDAVSAGLDSQSGLGSHILILYGDTPLITAETLMTLLTSLETGSDIAILGFHAQDPTGYGRLILDVNGNVSAIREQADASSEEREIDLCNSGVMAFKTGLLKACLAQLKPDNAAGEYYLTDCIEIARKSDAKITVVTCDETEVLGVNTQAQLAQAEHAIQQRLRARAMEQGVTLHDPGSVYFSHDTEIAANVIIEPNVIFGPGVTVGKGSTIKGHCHFEGAQIAENVTIGPFARLRPGADLADNVRVGNFVEIKQARIDQGAKVNHLSYIGDAHIGANANIGAGTITCNYDGYAKHFTEIGQGAFVGSNTALVAPVKIGAGAYIGSGSVISKSVKSNALVLTRADLTEKPDWAIRFRQANTARHSRNSKSKENK